jgi:hypothetical protein
MRLITTFILFLFITQTPFDVLCSFDLGKNAPTKILVKLNPYRSLSKNDTLVIPCGEPIVRTLLAGQNINAGSLTVSNDETTLFITYNTDNNWLLKKIHLYAGSCGTVPSNSAGNPMIGLFPYNEQFSPFVNSYTLSIPLDGLDECFCIAAHAELVKIGLNGCVIQTETGWAAGEPFGGKSWAKKFKYCIQDCPEPCDVSANLELVSSSSCSQNGGSAIITAAGGVEPYLFTVVNTSTGNIYTNTTGNFNNLIDGIYLVFVHDSNQCHPECQNLEFKLEGTSNELSHTVEIISACIPGQGNTVVLTPNGSTPPFLYSIGGGFNTNGVFNNLSAGQYLTTVIDANGCSSSEQITINYNQFLTVSVNNVSNETCSQQNGSIHLIANGGEGPYVFTLVNTANNQQFVNQTGFFTNLSAGNYSYTVTDENGCIAHASSTGLKLKNIIKNCHQIIACKSTENSKINAYPNPANDYTTLSIDDLNTTSSLTITFADETGRTVQTQEIIDPNQDIKLNLKNLSPGTYMIFISDEGGQLLDMTRLIVIP